MSDIEIHKEQFKKWLENSYGWMKRDLSDMQALSRDEFEKELYERFSVDAQFGTGGLRSVIRAGRNGINNFWIRRICKGLGKISKSVVIAYDTRHKSEEFAKEAANTLSADNCKVFLFNRPVPTPVLSFAIKHLGCTGGIVITASHNPKEYNGFKVYDSNGVQYVPSKVKSLTDSFKEYPILSEKPVIENNDLIELIGEGVIGAYFNEIYREMASLESQRDYFQSAVNAVYTPLHGTGADFVPPILERYGVNVILVEEQMKPDPEFSTLNVPNPEDVSSFEMAIKKAKGLQKMPQALIATDPDADRLGIMLNNGGVFEIINGNELGILLLDFILRRLKIKDFKGSSAVLKTIVTTDAIRPMAEKYNLRVYETLTGFKYLGEKALALKNDNINTLFSFEESFGYLFGEHARDKDACSTSGIFGMLLREHKTAEALLDRLDMIRKEYGYYLENLCSYQSHGVDGMKKLEAFMSYLRAENPVMNWERGITCKDYKTERGYLNADVLQYMFQGVDKIIFRPSGTEPKIKAYINVCAKDKDHALERLDSLKKRVTELFRTNLN